MIPIRATWSSFFGSRNSRFESQFRTKNTIYTIWYTVYMQPKKQLKVQYIGIFEEIDSFYWPKMHVLKKGMGRPPPLIRAMPERIFFSLPMEVFPQADTTCEILTHSQLGLRLEKMRGGSFLLPPTQIFCFNGIIWQPKSTTILTILKRWLWLSVDICLYRVRIFQPICVAADFAI